AMQSVALHWHNIKQHLSYSERHNPHKVFVQTLASHLQNDRDHFSALSVYIPQYKDHIFLSAQQVMLHWMKLSLLCNPQHHINEVHHDKLKQKKILFYFFSCKYSFDVHSDGIN